MAVMSSSWDDGLGRSDLDRAAAAVHGDHRAERGLVLYTGLLLAR